MKKHIGAALLLVVVCIFRHYAQVPQSDLYRFQLTQDDTMRWHIHSPQLISAWNTGGYTNQPEWLDDHTLLVSALRPGSEQNDIYLLNLSDRTIRQLTETPESEFSPQVTPDMKHFSAVRQVPGAEVDQQIYQFPLNLSYGGEPVYGDLRTVGYYCWLGADAIAAFLVDDPPKLTLLSLSEKSSNVYSSSIGRCLRRTSVGDLAYVHKYSDNFWFLKNMDPESRRAEILIETPFGKEDFAIGPSGEYFMGSGSTLYVFNPASDVKKWIAVFDLSVFGITNITRLAINEKHEIAIVDQR